MKRRDLLRAAGALAGATALGGVLVGRAAYAIAAGQSARRGRFLDSRRQSALGNRVDAEPSRGGNESHGATLDTMDR